MRAGMARVAATAIAALSALAAAAPPGPDDPLSTARIGLHVFDDAAGVPGDSVQGLAFDSQKRLMVATSRGVTRWEGRGFSPIELPGGSREAFYRAAIEAHDGSLFFARDPGGVLRLHDGKLTRYGIAEGLPNDRVNTLLEVVEKGHHVLYAGTYGGGLARLTGGRFVAVGDRAPTPRIWSLHETDFFGERALLVGGDGGLFRKDGERWVQVPLPDGTRGASINSFAETTDTNGRRSLWVGCYGRGVVRIDSGGTRLFGSADGLASLAVTGVVAVRRPAGGMTLFAGSRAGGVHRFDGTRFWPVPLGGKGIEVYRLAADDEGGLWVGTRGDGLLRLKSSSWLTLDSSSGLPGNHVWALAEVVRGDRRELWVGTTRGVAVFRGGRWDVLDTRNGLPSGEVAALAVTTPPGREPVVWIGTRANGLVRIEGGKPRILDSAHGFFTDRPTRLVAQGDTLWIGTVDHGVARLDGERLTPIPPPAGETWPQVLGLGLSGDPDDATVWVGVRDGVIAIRGDHAKRLDMSAFPEPTVVRVAEVRLPNGSRETWAGLNGSIARLRAGETRFTVLPTHGADLPAGTIYQLIQDLRGRVFVGAPGGFARLSLRPDGGADVTPLTAGDELPGNTSDYGCLLDGRGRVFLSTTAGLAVLDPENEEETPRAPRPLLLERAVSTVKGLVLAEGTRLPHDDAGVGFELTLLDYAADRPALYRTQLEGLEVGHGPFTEQRSVRFPSLPPGSYTFRAWARDHRGVVSGPVKLAFSVARSPLRTPLAYALYALAIVALGAAFVRLYEAALLRRNRALEALVEARTRQVTYARDEALAGSRAKSAFLASMSHELRTPLSAIIGYAEMLKEDFERTSPQAATDLGKIEAAARHQLHLVNEILDLSKIEAGKLELNICDFELDPLLHEAASTVAPLLEKRCNRMVVEVKERLGVVRLDALRVKQVILNLLSNASKFTEKGTVTLSGRPREDGVVLTVSDTGIGMTADQLARIFKPFTQADAETAARFGGTGLGLTIAKSFCEMLGGSISVDSELGKGSTFTVRLPRRASTVPGRSPV